MRFPLAIGASGLFGRLEDKGILAEMATLTKAAKGPVKDRWCDPSAQLSVPSHRTFGAYSASVQRST